MAEITTEKTLAGELREAAARLRESGGNALAGPWESLDNGDRLVAWRNVPGTDFDDDFEYVLDEPLEKETAEWMALVNPLLAEPLASWLEKTAKKFDDEVRGRLHDTCDGAIGEDCYCFREALAVARVLNGSAS
ncbi:hypothetical protein [Nonomuraea wenchangensis]|uniref:Uncharacterized protein n=1 Tax=Nonomuraea wenchangensis TaxID=568860 RepID=A0A1I0EZ73_9ACTN|nr:hypothetical protein [Nonomuraea wenchangensis]SET50975.1 hypothetical protein SAMN05421811_103262 [Nonomuraea wenchangensis]